MDTRPSLRDRFTSRGWLNPAVASLVLANLVPLIGVLFFGWDVFTVVFLYWLENGVIGFFNVLKMAIARFEGETMGDLMTAGGVLDHLSKRIPQKALREWTAQPGPNLPGGLKLFLIPFFIVHYSMFMAVHLVFIFVLVGPGRSLVGQTNVSMTSLDFGFDAWESASLVIALILLITEHGYAFYMEFYKSGAYRRTNPVAQMFKPYPRIVVLHVAILGGGFLLVLLSLPRLMLVLLVAMKIGLELRALARPHGIY